MKERSLSTAVGANQTNPFTPADLQIEIIQHRPMRLVVMVGEGDPFDLYDYFRIIHCNDAMPLTRSIMITNMITSILCNSKWLRR